MQFQCNSILLWCLYGCIYLYSIILKLPKVSTGVNFLDLLLHTINDAIHHYEIYQNIHSCSDRYALYYILLKIKHITIFVVIFNVVNLLPSPLSISMHDNLKNIKRVDTKICSANRPRKNHSPSRFHGREVRQTSKPQNRSLLLSLLDDTFLYKNTMSSITVTVHKLT